MRIGGVSAVMLMAFWAVGCSSYINPPTPPSTQTMTASLASLRSAKAAIETKLKEGYKINDTAGVVTFLAVAGAGGAAAYGANPELILGLGGAGGLAYTGGNLAAPAPVLSVYRSGLDALTCLEQPANAYEASLGAVKPLSTVIGSQINTHRTHIQTLDGLSPGNDQAQRANKQTALAEARAETLKALTAKGAAEAATVGEASIAATLYNAVITVVNDVNNKSVTATPNLQMVMAAAQGVFPVSPLKPAATPPGTAEALTVTDDNKDKEKPAAIAAAAGFDAALAAVRESTTSLQSVRTTLETAVSNFNTAMQNISTNSPNCKVVLAQVAPLSALPATVPTIKPGTRVRLELSGGQPPYVARWVGAAPAALSADVVGSSILLLGATGLTAGSATLLVDDAAGSTAPLSLAITTAP